MPKSDGGPAFPTCVSADNEGGLSHGDPGMTLRDWFAGKALEGLLATEDGDTTYTTTREDVAYAIADRMLAARSRVDAVGAIVVNAPPVDADR